MPRQPGHGDAREESRASQEVGRPAPFCPSAQPDMGDSVVFGLVEGTPTDPRVAYLDRPVRLTPQILATAAPVEPTEVFRIGAPCAAGCCQHFVDNRCTLAGRIVGLLPAVVTSAPPCALRPRCRWWQQEGVRACVRCPQIATRMPGVGAALVEAATPPGVAGPVPPT